MKKEVASVPRLPGVYMMKDAQGKVIYIGKANNLKTRINSYYTGKDTRPMAPFLMARTKNVEFIATSTPKEALILENNLIKKHHPRYNVVLRDDKTYYHLCLDPTEKYPRLQLARKKLNNRAMYFGPYPSGLSAKETLRFVQQIFPLRSCRDRDFKLRPRPCLEYQIGRCLAPCRQFIDEENYRQLVEGAVAFLRGRRKKLLSDLTKQMEDASQSLRYEEAARLRDRIVALRHVLEKQHVDLTDRRELDVVGVYAAADVYTLCLLFVRDGKMLGSKSFTPVKTRADLPEIVSSVLQQYYMEADLPDEIIVPCELPDEIVFREWLSEKKGKKIKITAARKGAKKALLDMACANAREIDAASRDKDEQKKAVLELLQEKLGLSNLPRRIECFDISDIGGKNAVGSMVVFSNGEPDRAAYRRFRIRNMDQLDDYSMMREVLSRRFNVPDTVPDLLVVDGGKGQLNIALAVLNELKIQTDVIGLAKEERKTFSTKGVMKKKESLKRDRVYLRGRKDALMLNSSPAALTLLQRIRDEAHRFALHYHRKLRQKDNLKSVLDEIPDIGERRKKILLERFGSAKKIKEASLNDLQNVPGIGKGLATKIYQALSND
ncbi:MAG TPA: excinuclease ABC subunit UvrC [Smithellaceae bacterium]|nr:excinuclease ABC subunit UvrC [Smithellaceae bacterium]HRS89919.1 excinuclease ABC subunit UvrC [Smithellaceae bacterium]HRV26682.1 excinuclease ABC subunit UvrC [Smithellaceae bacterium]